MELENLGWNILTIGFLATLVISVILAWGMLQQVATIWRHRSAQSIALPMFIGTGTLMLIQLLYAIDIASIALGFASATVGTTVLLVVFSTWRFRGLMAGEWVVLGLGLGAVLFTLLTPYKWLMFLTFSFVTVVSSSWQPITIWRNRSAGDLDKKLIWKLYVSTWFWILYGLATKDLVLLICVPCFFTIHTFNLVLMKKFPPNQNGPPRI